MLIDNSEFKNAELSYRRGYQQGAYDALQLALTGADSDEIRKWVEIDIYQWRLEGMTKPTKPVPPPRRRR
jgi:hypothetical protein